MRMLSEGINHDIFLSQYELNEHFKKFETLDAVVLTCSNISEGAVKLMRTRIRLMAQHKSMHSIIDATQREPRHGSA